MQLPAATTTPLLVTGANLGQPKQRLTVIFLFRRRQGMVHFSFAGFLRWWNIEADFEFRKMATCRRTTCHGNGVRNNGRAGRERWDEAHPLPPCSPSPHTHLAISTDISRAVAGVNPHLAERAGLSPAANKAGTARVRTAGRPAHDPQQQHNRAASPNGASPTLDYHRLGDTTTRQYHFIARKRHICSSIQHARQSEPMRGRRPARRKTYLITMAPLV